MFTFLNLTLYSFGPKIFVPLVKIGKFPKDLTEEPESCKILYYIPPICNSRWEIVI
jgi:hypothetical protein